jgi:sugar/nucleoside kinase (ribokinase family)
VGVDTNVYVAGNHIDNSIESNYTLNLDYVGQAGGYSSRGYAQLGRSTAFIGHVGDDFLGRYVRSELSRDGIDLSALGIDASGTSRSVNFVFQDGSRKNFYDGKGHMHIEPDMEAAAKVLSASRLAHFHIPNWARRLLPVARQSGLTIACDIQDVVDPRDDYRRPFIEAADILFFSAVNQSDLGALMDYFQADRPDRIIVAGMGSRGCALATEEKIRYFPPVPMEDPVVDANGAGDGLAVGFLTSYILEQRSLLDSILRGQIAARHTCALRASSSSLITAERMEGCFRELRASGWPRSERS